MNHHVSFFFFVRHRSFNHHAKHGPPGCVDRSSSSVLAGREGQQDAGEGGPKSPLPRQAVTTVAVASHREQACVGEFYLTTALFQDWDFLLINSAKAETSAWDAAEDPNFTLVLYNPDKLKGQRFTELKPWAASQAASLNIPAVHLSTAGAVAMSSLAHSRVDGARGSKFPFPEIYYHEHEIRKFISMAKKNPTGVDLGSLGFKSIEQSHKIMFINSCREMEGNSRVLLWRGSLVLLGFRPAGAMEKDSSQQVQGRRRK
nr:beta-D-glucosyl crocetin beta-1,6-glucosyltransferase-like [Ipomoea batatas]